MHFQISLSLCELQIIRDWLCVRDIAETYLRVNLYLQCMKKKQLTKRNQENFEKTVKFLALTQQTFVGLEDMS